MAAEFCVCKIEKTYRVKLVSYAKFFGYVIIFRGTFSKCWDYINDMK